MIDEKTIEVMNNPCPKNWKSPLPLSFRYFIINKYIGIENWNRVCGKTKFILMKEAMENHRRLMVQKFGSIIRFYDYLARLEGFSNYREKQLERLKDRGFKNQREYRLYLLEKNGKGLRSYTQLLKYGKLKKENKKFIIIGGKVKEIKDEIRIGHKVYSKELIREALA